MEDIKAYYNPKEVKVQSKEISFGFEKKNDAKEFYKYLISYKIPAKLLVQR
jgi:hypothetical protein